MPSDAILQIAPYLIAASQISRAVIDIVDGLSAGTMTEEEAKAKWDSTVRQVSSADLRWRQADQAARDA